MKNKGFTLIELLVVIAIIGILSSVVLASLNSARSKGNDAAIKGNLNGLRATAELYYDSNSYSYGGTLSTSCAAGFLASTTAISAIQAMSLTPVCYVGTSTYAVSSPLKTSGNWCIDSTGVSTSSTAASTGKCN